MKSKLLSIIIPINSLDYIDHFFSQYYINFMQLNSDKIELVFLVNGKFSKDILEYFKIIMNNNLLKDVINIIKSEGDNLIDVLNNSLNNIAGTFSTFIGSDDLYITDILNLAEFAAKKNYDAIKFPLNLVFFWENTKHFHSSLIIIFNKLRIKEIQPLSDISKLIINCGQDYSDLELVGLYHGLIKTSLLEEFFIDNGKYTGGFSPDIYFAITMSFYSKNALIVNLPFTVSGIGLKSNSYKSLKDTHQGDLLSSSVKFNKDFEKWSDLIPYYYSVETVWASTMIIALEDLDINYELEKNKLYLLVYLKYKNFRSSVNFYDFFSFISVSSLIFILNRFLNRLKRRMKSGLFMRKYVNNLDIQEVETFYKSINNNAYENLFKNLEL